MSQGPGDVPLLDYVINVGIAFVGAAVRFAREWRDNFADWDRERILLEGISNVLQAGFSGLLTFWVLSSWAVNPFYISFAVGIMGHAGPEGLAMLKDKFFGDVKARDATPPK